MTATRDEKIAQARRMRAEGRVLREIAEHFGVGVTTAPRWTDPEQDAAGRAAARAWKAANRERTRAYDHEYGDTHRGTCVRCGQPRGAGQMGPGVCQPCRSKARHLRCLLICEWWAQGKQIPDICAELGWSSGHLQGEMDRMRADGYDLPYRYRSGARAGAKHLDAMAKAA